ncbi:MAG TPA: DNA repair protein RadC [Bacilli bacterium]|nr:DNA repair protein RadC [Bacilli bacterium]
MNYLIKDIPIFERPRERLIRNGVNSLSNNDLLSIVLKTGTRNCSVSIIANSILKEINNITNLQDITLNKLISIRGIGKVKATYLLAALELGKRVYYEKDSNNIIFDNANKIYEYFKQIFINTLQECFYCLYLDNNKRLIESKLLFKGTINKSLVHPREVFKHAYLLSASNIICIHNHPSGNIKPSQEDINITKVLIDIGKLQNINVIDHIIIGNQSYYSFFENNNLY